MNPSKPDPHTPHPTPHTPHPTPHTPHTHTTMNTTYDLTDEIKTLLTLEVGNSREMQWEIGVQYSDGNYSQVRSGSLSAEGDLDALEELESEVDEVWECSSLATRYNLRRA